HARARLPAGPPRDHRRVGRLDGSHGGDRPRPRRPREARGARRPLREDDRAEPRRRGRARRCPRLLRRDRRLSTGLAPRARRAVLAEDAVVYEPAEGRSVREELERRTRIITRGLRGQIYLRRFLDPIRHPWFSFQVISHRMLRWAVPVFLVVAFVANLFLL